MSQPSLYLVCGLPGSGAQTYARAISEKSKFPFITMENIPTFLRDPREYYPGNRRVWNQVHTCMMNKQSCICYVPGITYADRIPFVYLFPAFRYHHLIWIKANLSICRMNSPLFSISEFLAMRKAIDKVTPNDIIDWDSVSIFKNVDNKLFTHGVYISPTFAIDIDGEGSVFV